ncbi:MAG: hypothetical protein M3Y58_05240 [Chloroflexota bacterium]|nr:hypothetical protein [Chloroflexota bacterium]
MAGGIVVAVHLHPYSRESPFLDDTIQIFVQAWSGYARCRRPMSHWARVMQSWRLGTTTHATVS